MSSSPAPRLQLPPNAQTISPQPKQSIFLQSRADIAIYGGAAGGGKTYALLLEAARHVARPGYGATIFRRVRPQITSQGGLWPESMKLYPLLGGKPNISALSWTWQTDSAPAQVRFAQLQYDQTALDYQGSQIPLIGFDELTHFSEFQFWYLLSRNRSTCGIRPYIRATCNPDADSWVAGFLHWWIDPNSGLPILDRLGEVRWMVRLNDRVEWGSSPDELIARFDYLPPGTVQPLSVCFVPATLDDNAILQRADPGYRARLLALPQVERERLLGGNWKIRADAGKVFNRSWFEIVDAVPSGGVDCRYWDFAGTEKKLSKTGRKTDPDFTAGVKIRKVGGVYYVTDVVAFQEGPAMVEKQVQNLAQQDFAQAQNQSARYQLRWEREPGSAAKRESLRLVQMFAGLDARESVPEGDKVVRAKGLSAQCEAGNVKILRADWNELFLREMHGFPDRPHDDIPDAASGCFNELPQFIESGSILPPAPQNRSIVNRAPAGVFRK